MTQGVIQAAFTMGEIAPNLYGRIDFDGYYRGLRTCRNMIISKYGGVDNRPGTRYVDTVHDSSNFTRLVPFKFNNQQQYVLELGNKKMRIIANGAVVTASTPYAVTGATPAIWRGFIVLQNVQLTVKSHPFYDGQFISVVGVADGVNGIQTVTKIDAETISLDGVTLQTFTWSGGGTVQAASGTPVVVTTPWASHDLDTIKITQSADVITACHSNYPTQQIERHSATDWRCVPLVNTYGPFQDINSDETITVTASAVTGDNITVTSSKDLFTADMVGFEFYIQQSPDNLTPAWEVAKTVSATEIMIYGDNYYQAAADGTTGTVPPTVTAGSQRDGQTGILWKYLHSGFGIVKITAVVDSKTITCDVVSRLPDSLIVNPANTYTIISASSAFGGPFTIETGTTNTYTTGKQVNITAFPGLNGLYTITVIDDTHFTLNNMDGAYVPFVDGGQVTNASIGAPSYYWALPAWGPTAQGYPSTSAYFQDRQLFGGSNGAPSNVWFSTTAGFKNFSVNNPVLDSDAITYKILSNQVNIVKHMMELAYLLIFTSGGIYMVKGGSTGDGVITPSTINLSFQGANPISEVAPIRVNNYALFVQEKGNQVRTLGYSFAENAFIGQDTTTMSNHLLQFWSIQDWCYQETPYSCIWAIRSDGVLLGLTFNPEQQITGWHRHDTQGTFESLCCITENNEDVVYFVVNRYLNGQMTRCIERMASRQFNDPADAYFVDCGLTYDGRALNTFGGNEGMKSTFSGLDHLEGLAVAILADGIVYPQQVVVDGTITIDHPALVVHIGLPYISQFETLDISSARADIRDKKKIINNVSLIVDKSSGFECGPDKDHLVPYKQRTTENYNTADNLLSELIDITVPCDWNKKGRVFVQQSKPLPLSILACIPQIEPGGY